MDENKLNMNSINNVEANNQNNLPKQEDSLVNNEMKVEEQGYDESVMVETSFGNEYESMQDSIMNNTMNNTNGNFTNGFNNMNGNMNANMYDMPNNVNYNKKTKKEKKKKEKNKKEGKSPNIFVRGIEFVGLSIVFGLLAFGTMYITGNTLGMIEGKNDKKDDSNIVIEKADLEEESTVVNAEVTKDSTNKSDNLTVVTDVSSVVDKVMPSIVAITSTTKVNMGMDDWFGFYYGYGYGGEQEQTGAGSGIIIGQNETELLIVTNNHVVEGADSLVINFIDDSDVDAYIKGTDSSKDLAVVAVKLSDIEKSTRDVIKIANMGDSDKLKVGEATIAIGNALGYGQSVTCGVVSALDREVTVEDRTMELIQTDAAINPGNSGGALLNSKGELIGINAAKYSSSSVEGMGFAIPVSSVSDIIEKLMNKETLVKVDEAKKGYINIYGKDVTDELAQIYNAPKGVLVVEVLEGGAAEKAGIEKSDIITKINDEEITCMEDMQNMLDYYEKGQKVKITLQYVEGKEYVEKEVNLVLGEKIE